MVPSQKTIWSLPDSTLPQDLASLSVELEQAPSLTSAMEQDFSAYGIKPSRCIDAELISRLFGIEITAPKDPYQRKECGCAAGRDIGMYDTCLFGCSYCYATSSFERAKANYARHDPDSPSLLPAAR